MKNKKKKGIYALLALSCCTSVMAVGTLTGCSSCSGCSGSDNDGHTHNFSYTDLGDGNHSVNCNGCNDVFENAVHVDTGVNGGTAGDDKCDYCEADMSEAVADKWSISIVGLTTREIDIDADNETLAYSVLKNDTAADAEVEISVKGDSVAYDKSTKKITPVKTGKTEITITLKDITDDGKPVSETVVYNVHEYFFAHDSALQRGSMDINDEDGDPYVTISGGNASLLYKKASTKFVFKCSVSVDDKTNIAKNSSFGVSSFLIVDGKQPGDNANWFGLRNVGNVGVGNPFQQYRRSFYDGWDKCDGEGADNAGYGELYINRNNIEFVIIRDGADYYFSIGGHYGKFTYDKGADIPTYAGVYSQEIGLEVTDFSWSDDADDIAEAIDTYYTKPGISVVKINEAFNNRLVKGTSHDYTASAYPEGKATGSVVWSLDKTGMTAGADATSVSASGTVTLAPDAAGSFKLICTVGSISTSVDITVLAEAEYEQNSTFEAFGGAKAAGDNGVTFPAELSTRNGIANSNNLEDGTGSYIQTYYCAVTKNSFTRNYSVSFDFSNLAVISDTPKFQISLGEEYGNFYLVYNRNNNKFQVQALVKGTHAGISQEGHSSKWHDSQEFEIPDYNPATKYNMTISVGTDGTYSVTVAGIKMSFEYKPDNNSSYPSTLVRSYDAYCSSKKIKLATQNCSVNIENFTVTNGTVMPDFYSEHKGNDITSSGDITMCVPGTNGWAYGNIGMYNDYKVYYTKALPDSFTLEFKAAFSDVMEDGKLCVTLGDKRVDLCNNMGELIVEHIGSFKVTVPALTASNTIEARLEFKDGELRIVANGKYIGTVTGVTADGLFFAVFNQKEGDLNKTIGICDFAVSDYSRKDVYELSAEDISLEIGEEKDLGVTLKLNGETQQTLPSGFTFDYTMNGGQDFAFKISGGKISVDPAVVGQIGKENTQTTVIATLKDGSGKTVATVSFTADCRVTRNDYINVKGGVILNDPDGDWSLTFPESKISASGIGENDGDDRKYVETSYQAVTVNSYSRNYTVSFDFSGYKRRGGENLSKLQISLGADNSNFYLVQNAEGKFRVEAFVKATCDNTNSDAHHDGWFQTDWFDIANYSPENKYNMTISVGADGGYAVSVNGVALTFNGEKDGSTFGAVPARSYEAYKEPSKIKLATQNCAVEISGFTVTNGTAMPDFYSEHRGNVVSGNGIEMTVPGHTGDGWAYGNWSDYTVHYTKALPETFTATFTVTFAQAMHDGKLYMMFANGTRLDLNNVNGVLKAEFGASGNNAVTPNGLTMDVRLERGAEGNLRIIINGKDFYTASNMTETEFKFVIFNNTEADDGKKITISDFAVTDYTALDIFELTASYLNVEAGVETPLGAVVKRNGSTISEMPSEYALTYAFKENANSFVISGDKISISEADGKLGKTTVVVATLKKGEDVLKEVEFTVACLPSENDVVRIGGGAILNIDEGANTWSVSFPEGSNTAEMTTKASLNKNLAVSFKLSDINAQNNGAMNINLGTSMSDFRLVYADGNLQFKITTKGTLEGVANNAHGEHEFVSNTFAAAGEHMISISVGANGAYTVTVDGTPLVFSADGHNAAIARNYEMYAAATPVKFTVENFAATISGVTTTDGDEMPDFYSENQGNAATANGVDMGVISIGGWGTVANGTFGDYNNVGWTDYHAYYTKTLESDFTMTFKVGYYSGDTPVNMSDGKLSVKIHGIRIDLSNSNGKLDVECAGKTLANGGSKIENLPEVDGATFDVRLERKGTNLRMIINGVQIGTVGGVDGNALSLVVFNTNGDDLGKTIKVTDFNVGAYDEMKIYEISASDITAAAGRETSVNAGVVLNLQTLTSLTGYELKYALSGENADVFTVSTDGIITVDSAKLNELTAAAKANLKITLKKGSDVLAEKTVSVICQLIDFDAVTVSGGVELNLISADDWSLTFPVAKQGTNGVGSGDDEKRYVANDYSADFKQTVSGDFAIEFTVSNYKRLSSQNYPKLMISLGGQYNQFYIAYDREGNGMARVETYTQGYNATGDIDGAGAWISSQYFMNANSDISYKDVTYKIVVIGGYYYVYATVAGGEPILLSFSMDNKPRTRLVRQGYNESLPIRMSTNGVSCTVSNIKIITEGLGDAPIAVTHGFNGNVTNVSGNATDGFNFTMKATNNSWDPHNSRNGSTVAYEPGITSNSTIEFDVTTTLPLSADDKLLIFVAGRGMCIDFANDGDVHCNIRWCNDGIGDYDNAHPSTRITDATTPLHVKIERNGDKLKVYFNGELLDWSGTTERSANADWNNLSFDVFNNNDSYTNNTVTITNLKVTNN